MNNKSPRRFGATVLVAAIAAAAILMAVPASADVFKPINDYQLQVAAQSARELNILTFSSGAGGTNYTTNNDLLVIGSYTMQVRTNNDKSVTNSLYFPIFVPPTGATNCTSPSVMATNLAAAINTNLPPNTFRASVLNTTNVVIVAENPGDFRQVANSSGITNATFGTNRFFGGYSVPTAARKRMDASRGAIAAEVTQGVMRFSFMFTPTIVRVQLRSSAGAVKVYDGVVLITGRHVTCDNSGSSDFAAGDQMTVQVTE